MLHTNYSMTATNMNGFTKYQNQQQLGHFNGNKNVQETLLRHKNKSHQMEP